MTNPDGMPIWYELMTTDADAAQAFYSMVVGWSIAPAAMPAGDGPPVDYRIISAPDGGGVGGVMVPPPGGPPPRWLVYLGVADVDAAAERVTALGGSVHLGPMDIPGVGRFAFVTDPQGMPFYIMRGDSPESSLAFHPTAEGHGAWNELVTTDHTAALAFYGALFGWESNSAMPMGPLGDYCFVDVAGTTIGATMTAGGEHKPAWNLYFRVPSVSAAAERAIAAGGTVHQAPMEVPGGDFIINGTDPQGAAFALVGRP